MGRDTGIPGSAQRNTARHDPTKRTNDKRMPRAEEEGHGSETENATFTVSVLRGTVSRWQ
jgi:hypothetical protein